MLTFPIFPHIPIVSVWKIDWMFPFFGIGLLLHEKIDWVRTNLKWVVPGSIVSFALLLLIFDHDYIYYFSVSRWFDYRALWNPDVHFLHIKSMWPCIYRVLVGVAGSMTFISLAMCLEYGGSKIGKFAMKLAPYGRYSLHLFIFGNAIFMIGHHFGVELPQTNMILYSFVYCPLIAIARSAIYIIIAKVLEKDRTINQYIFGQIR